VAFLRFVVAAFSSRVIIHRTFSTVFRQAFASSGVLLTQLYAGS